MCEGVAFCLLDIHLVSGSERHGFDIVILDRITMAMATQISTPAPHYLRISVRGLSLDIHCKYHLRYIHTQWIPGHSLLGRIFIRPIITYSSVGVSVINRFHVNALSLLHRRTVMVIKYKTLMAA